MTAPCKYPPGTERGVYGSIVHCSCPTWTGDFQVGPDGQPCSLPSYQGPSFVWSAANSVPSTSSYTTASPSKK